MQTTCLKTMAILNSMPFLDDLIGATIVRAMVRGFCPDHIHDAKIDGDTVTFILPHKYHPSLSTLVTVEYSFKDLIENPDAYIKEKVVQEYERFSNDNEQKNSKRNKHRDIQSL